MPERIQLSRKKGWRIPENTVTVARPSQWGNPVKIGGCLRVEIGAGMYEAVLTAEIAVAVYKQIIAAHLQRSPDMLKPLRGKNLACWCKLGAPCHGDVLLALANK